MKKLSMFFITICCFLFVPAFAQDSLQTDNSNDTLAQTGKEIKPDKLVDDAELLSPSQKSMLLQKLNEISERQRCDVVIVTAKTLGNKTAEAYADDYFDYNGYGYGSNRDGVLFLISMPSRDWAISTHGFGIPAFTDAGQQKIMTAIKPSLSKENFNSAFTEFATMSDDFLEQARNGKPYDIDTLPKEPTNPLKTAGISLLIGAVLAFIIVGTMKSALKSVSMQAKADDYLRSGSLKITNSNESYLYNTVSRVAIPKSSSGGSSTHTSSSGSTHGGSSGKF